MLNGSDRSDMSDRSDLFLCRWRSDEADAGGGEFLHLVVGPDRGLDFAYVGFLENEHAQAALAYASADGEGELAVEERFVEFQPGAFGAAGLVELASESLGVDADTHRRDFKRAFEHGVPYHDVAVEPGGAFAVVGRPVVVVGGAAVVGFPSARVSPIPIINTAPYFFVTSYSRCLGVRSGYCLCRSAAWTNVISLGSVGVMWGKRL